MTKEVILVGNGSSLLDAERGAEIDEFETVVRFNAFRLLGLEKHAGTKTDVWVRHPWLRTLRSAPQKYVRVTEGQRIRFRALFVRWTTLLPTDGEKMLEREFKPQDGFRYTTGMSTLAHYVLHHPVVRIAGFRSSEKTSALHYYHDGVSPDGVHDYALERTIIDTLKSEGRVEEW